MLSEEMTYFQKNLDMKKYIKHYGLCSYKYCVSPTTFISAHSKTWEQNYLTQIKTLQMQFFSRYLIHYDEF